MKNKINYEWLQCPNCNSGNLEHFNYFDNKTSQTIKRITHCRDCNLIIIEFFGAMFIQKNKPFILEEDEIKQCQDFPRA